MIRWTTGLVGGLCALVLSASSVASCTLILDTEAIITACTVDQECDDELGPGYQCEENACLPVDEIDGTGEGEGE